MKKLIPILLAAAVFVGALFLLRPPATVKTLVTARDLAAGHVLTADDLRWAQTQQDRVPQDAVLDPKAAVGQMLKTDRAAGDVLRQAHLGEPVRLESGERAIALQVNRMTGIGGLVKPGDHVGVTAVTPALAGGARVFDQQGAFSKVTVENLKTLYVSPEFRADYQESSSVSSSGSGSSTSLTTVSQPQKDGTVVLAVPVKEQIVQYDFASTGGEVVTRTVNAVELLAALGAGGNTVFSLYAMPADATPFTSAGLFVPDLVVIRTPTPSPTPTDTPMPGFRSTAAPAPTAARPKP